MPQNKNELQDNILKFIQKYATTTARENYEEDFNTLALTVFSYQFEHNFPYRKYAQSKFKTPLTVTCWEDIPTLPIQAFKNFDLSTVGLNDIEDIFTSSGTSDSQNRSKNYHPNFEVWDSSMKNGFKKYVLPDRENIQILSLFPGIESNPHSSLSRYVSQAVSFFGTADSHIFVDQDGIDYSSVVMEIQRAEKNNTSIMLLGASFSFVYLLDYLSSHHLTFFLSEKSIIFDTGGFKGKTREINQDKFYNQIQEVFHIKRSQIINMYGMTEVSSQCYDQNILHTSSNQPISYSKAAPAWVKIQVLSFDTLQPVGKGERGLLAFYDLSNWNSCMAILTEDIAIQNDTGFVLQGRANGSESKGCSIALDELLQSL